MATFALAYYALVRNPAGELLLLRRPDTASHFPGQWELPGGKGDPGEPPGRAVRREVREETGLDVEPLRLAGATEFLVGELRVIMLVIECACPPRPRVRLSEEHQDCRWVAGDRAGELDLTEQLRTILAGWTPRDG